MSASGKTAAPIEAPYALSTDHPLDVPALTKAMAERLHALLKKTQTKRSAEVAVTGNFSTSTTMAWPAEFADTSYTVSLAVFCKTGALTTAGAVITAKTKAHIELLVYGTGAQSGTELVVEATAMHD